MKYLYKEYILYHERKNTCHEIEFFLNEKNDTYILSSCFIFTLYKFKYVTRIYVF